MIRVPERDRLRIYLRKAGIDTEAYYPIPFHLQACFKPLGYRTGEFPQCERAAQETLALPMYPELTDEQQAYVVDRIREFLESRREP